MTKKTYNFEIISSRHHGKLVEYTCEDESCEDEYFKNDNSFEIELTMPPENSYIIYIINEYPNWCIEDEWITDTLDDAKNAVLKIYSQINDHLPYKEFDNEGFYPSIPEEIEKMDKIDLDFPSDVLDEEHYFAVIVNSEGIVHTQMLHPD